MTEFHEIVIKPIGFVRSEAKEREEEAHDWWQNFGYFTVCREFYDLDYSSFGPGKLVNPTSGG